jgi:glycine/D-amino acid oxidase-like deaminating enzyme
VGAVILVGWPGAEVGPGAVGSTFAYALAQKGLADEIDLIDANRDLAEGQDGAALAQAYQGETGGVIVLEEQ